MPVTDVEVRKKIRDIIKTVVPAGTRVWHRWMADQGEQQWAGYLTVEDGASPEKGKIHGYMISRRKAETERRANGGKMHHWWTYTIAGFHHYSRGDDDSNSEDTFAAELAAIALKFAQKPVLDLDGEDDNVLSHDELQIGLMHTAPFNKGLAHVAQCYLTVLIYEQA